MAGGRVLKATKQRRDRRIKQIEFLLENLTEPCFNPDTSFDSLSKTFTVDNSISGFNPCGITIALMNFQPHTKYLIETEPDNADQFYSLASFMNSIQSYLPSTLRQDPRSHVRLWNGGVLDKNHLTEPMLTHLKDLMDWFQTMKHKIENDLATRYICGGKPQYIEVLKRRYKNTWSEKTENESVVQQNVSGGMNINISFDDIDEQTN